MSKRSRPAGNKRQRERDKQRKRQEKEARKKLRKDMRARGLDPDALDEEGRPVYDERGEVIDYAALAAGGSPDGEATDGEPSEDGVTDGEPTDGERPDATEAGPDGDPPGELRAGESG